MSKVLKISIFSTIIFLGGLGVANAATVTCYSSCSPNFSNYVGTVVLDLQCTSGSPTSYTGWLTVNGATISYNKSCPPPPPPIPPTPSASSASCNAAGTQATISWSGSGATYYAIRNDRDSNSWSGTCASINPGDTCENTLGTSRTFATTPGNNNQFWVHACNGSGCSAGVASRFYNCPPPAPAATLSFSASPSSILRGNSSTLTWSTTNAVSCTATGGWSGPKSASGGITSVSPITNTTYRLECWNSAGVSTGIRNAPVTVTIPPLKVEITSSPELSANVGQEIGWTATVSGGIPPYTFPSNAWSGAVSGSGTPISSNRNYIEGIMGTVGPVTVRVQVTDSTGLPATDEYTLDIVENRDPQ